METRAGKYNVLRKRVFHYKDYLEILRNGTE